MRKLASIQRVKSISDIYRRGERAENIVLINFENIAWQCVGKRAEFKVGDLCVYVEVSTILPEHPVFEFMSRYNYRVKTVKMWGHLSQGLSLPISILNEFDAELNTKSLNEGDDVSDIIGIKRIEDVMPAKLHSEAKGLFPTHLIPKTDEDRIQSYPNLLNDIRGKSVIATVKMDGSSMTVLVNPEGELDVCSRNLTLKYAPENAYWRAVAMYPRLANLANDEEFRHLYFQGELVGDGIQGNPLCITGVDYYVFNIFDSRANRPLSYVEMMEVCEILGLKIVPVFDYWEAFYESVESLLEMIEPYNYEGTENPIEGIVVRTEFPTWSTELGKWFSFKAISNRYLLKRGE